MNFGSELEKLRKERNEWKESYELMREHAASLEQRLQVEELINDQYREFFTTNPEYCNWMRDHNANFEAFKNSPYYGKISPVAPPRQLE